MLKRNTKALRGLYRLFLFLRKQRKYDAVADLHNVLRTQIIRRFFAFTGLPVSVIDKGRKEKKELTRTRQKKLTPLPSTFQRYEQVFARLGFPVVLDIEEGIAKHSHELSSQWKQWKREHKRLIGIAPFAQYAEKTYPAVQMQQVIGLLLQRNDVQVFLFGGKADVPSLEQLALPFDNKVTVLAGKGGLASELQFISGLDVMISMDSANMHLASMYGVPVVSVWGGTHPFLGFNGWGQPLNHCVQIDLDCRPSSVFGNKECHRQQACLKGISPLMIANKVWEVLGK